MSGKKKKFNLRVKPALGASLDYLIKNMSEENTKEMDGAKPILERILARLDSMDERLRVLEEQSERRAMETKPMWERALAEILEVKENQRVMSRKLDILNNEVLNMKAEQLDVHTRVEQLEKRPS